jgi:sigma-B regulation protein RsbU (phosphoserine phosphatase)
MSPDLAALERELHVYKGLVEVSALINGIMESSELLPAILDVARRVLGAEAASLFLVNDSGDLELAAARGGVGQSSPVRIIVPRGRGISGWVLQHGEPVLVRDAYSDPRFFSEADQKTGFRTRSILCVPLVRNGKEIGVLQGLNPSGREAFDDSDLKAFAAYATLAATAIDKLRTIEREREQLRTAQELAFAREIQVSFLPQVLPYTDELSFAATYRPARNVGGDFYDVVEGGPGEFYFVIGDVSGKGMPAALFMAQALSMLRLILKPGISPEEALSRWNAMLINRTIHGMFITAIVGRVLVDEHKVEFANAGHCRPFLIHTSGNAEELQIPGAPPIAVIPKLPPSQSGRDLAVGEFLVFCTDGLTESFDAENRPLESGGVLEILHGRFDKPSDVIDAINAGELNHRRDAEPHDDLTVLVFGFRAIR